MNEKKKQGFATFFGRASLGRKLSAGFYWIAAILLLILLFVPLLSFSYDSTNESFSLLDYFIASEKLDFFISGSNTISILLLTLYILFLLATFICSLFTMNILSFFWTIGCILEVVLLYKLRVEPLFSMPLPLLSLLMEVNLEVHSLYLWIFLAVIGIIAIVGLVFHFILRGDAKEEDNNFYDFADDGRDMETGLAGPIATLKRLNTNETFNILDNSVFLIGKNPDQVHIVITNSAVSRVHAKITSRNGSCAIEDMGSSNGTFMNDQRLIKGVEYPLKGDTYITLGNEILQFQENL